MSEHMPSEDRMRELLMGRRITKATVKDEKPAPYEQGPTGYLTLDDGTVLKVWGNDGGCACSAGCYPLRHLAAVDNVITNVEIEEQPDYEYPAVPCRTCGKDYCWEDEHDNEGYYRVFVFADNERINVASFEGSDGNGYYGTGWYLDVIGVTNAG